MQKRLLSGTPGGDGQALLLSVLALGVVDVGTMVTRTTWESLLQNRQTSSGSS